MGKQAVDRSWRQDVVWRVWKAPVLGVESGIGVGVAVSQGHTLQSVAFPDLPSLTIPTARHF